MIVYITFNTLTAVYLLMLCMIFLSCFTLASQPPHTHTTHTLYKLIYALALPGPRSQAVIF